MSRITSFEVSLQLLDFPPNVEAIDTALNKTLTQGQRALNWAIVRADATTKTVWIEGSLINNDAACIPLR